MHSYIGYVCISAVTTSVLLSVCLYFFFIFVADSCPFIFIFIHVCLSVYLSLFFSLSFSLCHSVCMGVCMSGSYLIINCIIALLSVLCLLLPLLSCCLSGYIFSLSQYICLYSPLSPSLYVYQSGWVVWLVPYYQ